MGTVIRPEISKKSPYYISKHRYYELRHFCLQYPEWKRAYHAVDGFSSKSSEGHEHVSGGGTADPTAVYAEKRLYWLDRMKMVERTARETDEIIARFLLRCVTEGISYEQMRAREPIPCGKDYFYDAYRRFFWLLDKARK